MLNHKKETQALLKTRALLETVTSKTAVGCVYGAPPTGGYFPWSVHLVLFTLATLYHIAIQHVSGLHTYH